MNDQEDLSTEPLSTELDSSPTDEPSAPAAVEPAPTPFDFDEFERRHTAATAKAIANALPQAHPPTPPSIGTEPATEALQAIHLARDLEDEIDDILADVPVEYRRDAKARLREFNSLPGLQLAKQQGVQKVLADAAYGRAVRDGKYLPENARSANVSREPVHSEPVMAIPTSYRQEVAEIEAILGVKFTDAEIRAGMGHK